MDPNPAPKRGGALPWVDNWIGLAGIIIILGSIFAFLLLFVIDLFAGSQNPYVGILTWVIAPGFFFLGLVLVGIGRILYGRELARAGAGRPYIHFIIDLSSRRHRQYLFIFGLAGVAFLLVSAIGSYQTYHATSSTQFCGAACHLPMGPQYTAYKDSPHAKVGCTECHIGSGAANMVKAKFNGVNQLCSTVLNNFHRPIIGPGIIQINQKTCEQCHWPERFVPNLDRTYHHFLAEEANTPFSVRLSLKVGGGSPSNGPSGGIHWHMNIANKVEYYATDKLKQDIPWVRVTHASGEVEEFRRPDFTGEPPRNQIHIMDCMDCHNRPAHQFLSPNDAVDQALHLNELDRSLPSIKLEAVKALTTPAATTAEGLRNIADAIRAAYPDHPARDKATVALQRIFQRNFFPEMKTDWRTHPDNIGHKDAPGCFRCHDGMHKTPDGSKTLGASDCNSCHTILAQGSGEDLEKLSAKGHPFLHIDAPYSDFNCHSCHTGALPKE